jgi:putative flippase GtrA
MEIGAIFYFAHDRSAPTPKRVFAFVPQLSRYSIVSLAALFVDFGSYLALCALTLAAPMAGIASYCLGMIVHYALSTRFVFDVADARKSARRRFTEFLASGLLGVALTGVVIAILTKNFGASPFAAKAAAVGVSFLAVFLVRRWIVFAPVHHDCPSDAPLVYAKSGSCH